MPLPDRQSHSSLAEAHRWVSRLTTVSLEMALPAFLGNWLDKKWGTTPWLAAIGALLGFALGMTHLLRMAKEAELKKRKRKDQPSQNADKHHDGLP
ncbi:AtpZ/AtpI family protein [uncultured Gimesia sp.]|uniref:AtpZ/AtpI family protein n=1 Tax=uncultured Gimesia sp. TaxID=1678688 RepID=UPI0030D811C7|tara:strand:+ start:3058 stop:3345 length:288 start_codon:yes stop_codon:yes gene_type:complete